MSEVVQSGNWSTVTLGEVCDRIRLKNQGKSDNVLTISGQYGLVSQTEFFKKFVASKNLDGYILLTKGDFAYNKSYSDGYPFGAIKRLEKYARGVVSTLYLCFRPKAVVNGDFLKHYFDSNLWHSEVREIAQEGGRSHGLLNVGVEDFFGISLTVPSLPEQRKIAAILTSVDDAIAATQRIIDQTEVVKRGLMQELLTKGIGHMSFKETDIGEIPAEWQVLTLREMLEKGMIVGHQDGNHGELYPRSEEFTDQGVPYLAANCITDGQIDLSLAKFLPMERASKFKKGVAKNQDVLFAHNATVGPVSVLKTDLDFVVLSTTLTYYRCNMEFINPYYLSQFMTSPMFVGQYKRVMGQTTRNQVPLTLQRKFFHVIPSISEQMRITEILSSFDNKLLGEKRKLSILLNLKQGLMQVLLTGKIRVNVDEPSEVSV